MNTHRNPNLFPDQYAMPAPVAPADLAKANMHPHQEWNNNPNVAQWGAQEWQREATNAARQHNNAEANFKAGVDAINAHANQSLGRAERASDAYEAAVKAGNTKAANGLYESMKGHAYEYNARRDHAKRVTESAPLELPVYKAKQRSMAEGAARNARHATRTGELSFARSPQQVEAANLAAQERVTGEYTDPRTGNVVVNKGITSKVDLIKQGYDFAARVQPSTDPNADPRDYSRRHSAAVVASKRATAIYLGRTPKEREATADAYMKDIEQSVVNGAEYAQAEVMADLKLGDRHNIANLTSELIKEGVDPAEAHKQATARYARTDAARRKFIVQNNILTMSEYTGARDQQRANRDTRTESKRMEDHAARQAENKRDGFAAAGEAGRQPDLTSLADKLRKSGKLTDAEYAQLQAAVDAMNDEIARRRAAGGPERGLAGLKGKEAAPKADELYDRSKNRAVNFIDKDPKSIDMYLDYDKKQSDFAQKLALMHAKDFGKVYGQQVNAKMLEESKKSYVADQEAYYKRWEAAAAAATNPDGTPRFTQDEIKAAVALSRLEEARETNQKVEFFRLRNVLNGVNEKTLEKSGGTVNDAEATNRTQRWMRAASNSKMGRQVRRALTVALPTIAAASVLAFAHNKGVNVATVATGASIAAARVRSIRKDDAAARIESNDKDFTPYVFGADGQAIRDNKGNEVKGRSTLAGLQRHYAAERLDTAFKANRDISATEMADMLIKNAKGESSRNRGRVFKTLGAAVLGGTAALGVHEVVHGDGLDLNPFNDGNVQGRQTEQGAGTYDGTPQNQDPKPKNSGIEDGSIRINGQEFDTNYNATPGMGWVKYLDAIASQNGMNITREEAQTIFENLHERGLINGDNLSNFNGTRDVPGPDVSISKPGATQMTDSDFARLVFEQIQEANKSKN